MGKISDILDNMTSSSDRAGRTVDRVSKMRKAGVSPRTIASQMTDNDVNGLEFTEQDVLSYEKLAEATKTRVPITKTQAKSLIEDQKEYDNSDLLPA